MARLKWSGFDTLVVTADAPVTGNRENNARNGFDTPFRLTPRLAWQCGMKPGWTIGTLARELAARGMPHFENMDADQGPPLFSRTLTRSILGRDRLTWDHLAHIRKIWPGRVILKGVMSATDAIRARGLDLDGIIVSSQGGRQLDFCAAPPRSASGGDRRLSRNRSGLKRADMLLELNGLASHYGRIQALRDVSVTVAEGEIVALVGANGAGKTILLRVLSGVQPLSAGAIHFDGADISRTPAHKRVALGIAQVPEGRQVFGPLSVEDNLRLGAYRRSGRDLADDIEKMYAMFPILKEKRKDPAGTMSGGQQQATGACKRYGRLVPTL